MIYNHRRERVEDWQGGESYCPECRVALIARRGALVVWHWAHRAQARHTCGHDETAWHLRMKAAYLDFAGWEIEVPLALSGRTYRVDAMNTTTKAVREFVHSLSPYYEAKHRALHRSGCAVLWILDGAAFASERREHTRTGNGWRHLLKPKAYALHAVVDSLVHYDGCLWREWRENVWFPTTGPAARSVLDAYARQRVTPPPRTPPSPVPHPPGNISP